jgi:pimeloyl-ACP methyl ester carboxylesterase
MSDRTAVRDETIVLNGLRFHYRDRGDPEHPALVLLHAYTSHTRSWDTFASAMADRFRVLALDQRGHGESDWAADYHEQRLVDDLAAFVEALGLAPVSLVGFSIGGSTALSYAALHSGRVERLVVAEVFALETNPETVSHIRALRSVPATYQGSAEEVAAAAAIAYRPLAPQAPDDELRRWMIGGLAQEPEGNWTLRYDPILRVPGPPGRLNPSPEALEERLKQVSCPTLLVVGRESFHVEGAERMVTANPRARLVRVPDAGHWVPLDNPPGFLDVVGPFLDGAR